MPAGARSPWACMRQDGGHGARKEVWVEAVLFRRGRLPRAARRTQWASATRHPGHSCRVQGLLPWSGVWPSRPNLPGSAPRPSCCLSSPVMPPARAGLPCGHLPPPPSGLLALSLVFVAMLTYGPTVPPSRPTGWPSWAGTRPSEQPTVPSSQIKINCPVLGPPSAVGGESDPSLRFWCALDPPGVRPTKSVVCRPCPHLAPCVAGPRCHRPLCTLRLSLPGR